MAEETIFAGLENLLKSTTEELEIDLEGTVIVPKTDDVDDKNKQDKETLIDLENITPDNEEDLDDDVEDPTLAMKALATVFKEKEILPSLNIEEFDGTEESLIKAMQNEISEGVEDYKSGLPPVIKELIDNYEEGVPLEELIKVKSNQATLANIKETDLDDKVELQKNIVREHLRVTTNFTEAKIEKAIERLETLDSLVDESKDALKEIKLIEADREVKLKAQAKAKVESDKKQHQEILGKIKDIVESTQEIIPGIKLAEKEKKDLYALMTGPTNKIVEIREKDPYKFDTTLAYLTMKGFFDGKIDDVIKKLKTGVVESIEKNVNESVIKTKKDGIRNGATSSSLLSAASKYIKKK